MPYTSTPGCQLFEWLRVAKAESEEFPRAYALDRARAWAEQIIAAGMESPVRTSLRFMVNMYIDDFGDEGEDAPGTIKAALRALAGNDPEADRLSATAMVEDALDFAGYYSTLGEPERSAFEALGMQQPEDEDAWLDMFRPQRA